MSARMWLIFVSSTLALTCKVVHDISLQKSAYKEEKHFAKSYNSIFFSKHGGSRFCLSPDITYFETELEPWDHKYIFKESCNLFRRTTEMFSVDTQHLFNCRILKDICILHACDWYRWKWYADNTTWRTVRSNAIYENIVPVTIIIIETYSIIADFPFIS